MYLVFSRASFGKQPIATRGPRKSGRLYVLVPVKGMRSRVRVFKCGLYVRIPVKIISRLPIANTLQVRHTHTRVFSPLWCSPLPDVFYLVCFIGTMAFAISSQICPSISGRASSADDARRSRKEWILVREFPVACVIIWWRRPALPGQPGEDAVLRIL